MTYRRTEEKKINSLFGDDEFYTPSRSQRHPPSLLDLDRDRHTTQTPTSQHKPHTPIAKKGGDAPPTRSLRECTPYQTHQTPGASRFDHFSFSPSPSPPPSTTPPQPSAPSLPIQSYQENTSQRPARITEVTVFGFPPHKAAVVMTRMLRYGEIVRRTDGSGNWFHLQYRDSLGAEMALTQNGKILDGDTMIGVKPRQLDEIHLAAALRQGVTSDEAENEITYGKSIFDRPRRPSILAADPHDSTPTESFPSRTKPWLNQFIDALFNW